MLVLRPVREDDLAGLVALAKSIGGGLTTLPPDEQVLGDRIQESLRAFNPRVRKPGGERYLFALTDTASPDLVGVSGIASRVGGFEPSYSYEIRPERFTHAPLNIEKSIPVLHLRQEHRGPSELCSLFLRADRRGGGAGRLLSLGRLPFIGTHPQRFTETIVAEMRGFLDPAGRSPFWEAVARAFFEFDFYAADVLSGLGEKQFIADLMPRHPLYIPLLAPEVQAVIGRVHPDTEPALALLLAEGFARTNEVDIFDAGPVLRATIASLRTVRASRRARLAGLRPALPPGAAVQLVANPTLDYRAVIAGVVEEAPDAVSLAAESAAALQLQVGDELTWAPLK